MISGSDARSLCEHGPDSILWEVVDGALRGNIATIIDLYEGTKIEKLRSIINRLEALGYNVTFDDESNCAKMIISW